MQHCFARRRLGGALGRGEAKHSAYASLQSIVVLQRLDAEITQPRGKLLCIRPEMPVQLLYLILECISSIERELEAVIGLEDHQIAMVKGRKMWQPMGARRTVLMSLGCYPSFRPRAPPQAT
jgi:hypothetical protein